MRAKIFSQQYQATIQQTVIFALLGIVLVAGDWAIDDIHLKKSSIFRGAVVGILLISAWLKSLSKSPNMNYVIAYLSMVICEIVLMFLFNILDDGLKAGVGQLIYFYIGSLMFCAIFPFNYNILGCFLLTVVPIAYGILFTNRFPLILYISVLGPAYILTILLHYRFRFLLVEVQNTRQQIETSSLIEPVTGLANYRGFERLYKHTIKLGQVKPFRQFMLLIEIQGLNDIKTKIDEKQTKLFQEKIGELIERSAYDIKNISACLGESEFAIILQQVSEEEAYSAAEAIRKAIAGKEFDSPVLESGKAAFKASIGIALADSKEELKLLISRARISLNQAVSQGGNQCVII